METPQPFDSPKKLRVNRIEVGANLFIQIIVWLAIVVMLNYWSMRHYWRWDWGYNLDLQLSGQTKALLANLEKPVQAIVFFSGQNPEAEADAKRILDEYKHASNNKLTIEIVNPYANEARANELATKYKFSGQDSMVIFDYDGRSKFVNSAELAVMEQIDPRAAQMAMMQGREVPAPRMLEFKGEQVMTSALLEIIEPKQKKVYFVSGHGELDYNSVGDRAANGVEEVKRNLSRQNLQHAELKFSSVDKIPDDADAILIAGPSLDYSERDLKILSEYWDRKGRIFVTTGPTVNKKPNLEGWLAARGVAAQGDDVIRVQGIAGVGIGILRYGEVTPIAVMPKELHGAAIQSDKPFQSLKLDRTKETSQQLRIAELMTAPLEFWGEKTPVVTGSVPTNDTSTDNQLPLALAAIVEKGAPSDVKLPTSRLVVVGNSHFLSDRILMTQEPAIAFISSAVNWLISRENLISIPPKAKERKSFTLAPEKLGTLSWWAIAYIPLSVAIFGLYHLWWRHGRNLLLLTAWLAGAFMLLVGAWYLLLYVTGNEGAKSVPRSLVIALLFALVLGAAAVAMHVFEQGNRLKQTRPKI